MHLVAEFTAHEAQPGNPGMGGFGHLTLHVEMKYRLGAAGSFFGQPPPAGIAGPRRAVACRSVANEIDVGVVLVSAAMPVFFRR